ncbi:hypothetical protein PENSPDRAFT_686235 [Peniophora sp. CONT]|nr:hypothetical protein PENSPDRAFT_686235 [Peniophora sp. CONT]
MALVYGIGASVHIPTFSQHVSDRSTQGAFMGLVKETTFWDPVTQSLQRRENDAVDVSLLRTGKGDYLRSFPRPHGELSVAATGLQELRESGLCRTTKTQTQENGVYQNGVMYLITCNLYEYRGNDHCALSVVGFDLANAIYTLFDGQGPAEKSEYQIAEKMMRERGGKKKDNPTSKGLMMAKEAEVTAKLQVVQVEAQLAASEREKEDLQLQAVALQQQLDEERAAADAIRAEVGRLKAEASMARTRSAFASTPARSTNPAASLPTPDSLAPGAPRRQPPVEPVTPSRPGPSSSQRSFGSPADQDDDMQFFGGDEPLPDADELPQPAAFRPASPPPTPGPSNVNVHAECEERFRTVERERDEARGIATQITAWWNSGQAWMNQGQKLLPGSS